MVSGRASVARGHGGWRARVVEPLVAASLCPELFIVSLVRQVPALLLVRRLGPVPPVQAPHLRHNRPQQVSVPLAPLAEEPRAAPRTNGSGCGDWRSNFRAVWKRERETVGWCNLAGSPVSEGAVLVRADRRGARGEWTAHTSRARICFWSQRRPRPHPRPR
eukprot:scaffold10253_cov124-Isochrysis_galbana.AAC.20